MEEKPFNELPCSNPEDHTYIVGLPQYEGAYAFDIYGFDDREAARQFFTKKRSPQAFVARIGEWGVFFE